MNFFGSLFASKSPTERVRQAARRDGLKYNQKTAAELSALISGAIDDALIDLLFALEAGGPYCHMARDALNCCGHPKAVARLLDTIERGDQQAEQTALCFAHPANATAAGVIARLIQIANTSRKYHAVAGAARALSEIGTADAKDGLRLFKELPSRDLYFDYSVDEDSGASTPIYRSSAFLGQQPDARASADANALLQRENPFLFASGATARCLLQDCLAAPQNRLTLLANLEVALVDGFNPSRLMAYDRQELPPIALEQAMKAAKASWPDRLKQLREILAEEDTSRLEAYLLNSFMRGNARQMAVYQALPQKRPISELPGLDQAFTTLAEIEDYAAVAPRREALMQIDRARALPEDTGFRLGALLKSYANLPPEMRRTVTDEFITPQLSDPRWEVRRQAIKALANLPAQDSTPLLQRYLESGETDFELLSHARDAIKHNQKTNSG